ncbi:Bug family tripartite tricarboxylate transporter substrate binding protein [Pseudoroseomonas sp. WGS1072]|uniref:Bug family tripartite tricarboxylate transporter substrate binding protein n=1 Tax=Roseomonas sp. WGS1072 TaxID=3366816 RepID=UPI003BF32C5A
MKRAGNHPGLERAGATPRTCLDQIAATRRAILRGGLAAAALPLPTWAQPSYPSRPVTIVIPFAPGGQTDPVGRFLANHLQRALGQPFVIDNRSGAGGTIGASQVIRSAPDGYTLLLSVVGTYATAPFIYGKGSYDPTTAFTPIALVMEGAMVLVTHPRSGLKSVADVLATARTRNLTFASPGVGTLPHLMGEILSARTGRRLTHVPYRGGAPAMTDLISGQVDLFIDVIPNVLPHVQEGRVMPLLVSGSRQLPVGTVPNAKDAGFPELDLMAWSGLAGPAGLPEAAVATLNHHVNEAMRTDEGRALLERLGANPASGRPGDMRERIVTDSSVYRKVIEANSISAL